MTLSRRDTTLTLTGIVLAVFLGALDQTIVSTALPRIVEDLGGVTRYAWVATAYLLASTVLVPIYGKLADLISRRTLVLFSIGTFLAGSFLCGLSGEFGALPLLGDGMNQLIAFRAVQGLGGAGLFSLAFIVIADLFPPRERGKYQGLIGATFGVASLIGPSVGGLLTDYGGAIIPGIEGWRWVFYVNVPFGALALWFVAMRMPPLRPAPGSARLDVMSAVFLIAALVPLVLGLQLDRTAYPWGGATTLTYFAVALTFGTAFVLRSLRSAAPVLEVRLFGNRVFATANLAAFFLGGAFLSTVIFLPLFMVNVLGVSATRSGVSLIPLTFGTVAGSIFAGQLAARLGRYKGIMIFGASVLLLAMVLLSTMSAEVPYWRVTVYMVIAGIGVGPGLPLYTLAIQNAIDASKLGQATSAAQFFRQIGGAVAVAVMGTILASGLGGLPGGGAGGFEGAPAAAGGAGIPAFVRLAFADAITDVFGALVWVVAAGLIATLLVPSLPLLGRRGNPGVIEG